MCEAGMNMFYLAIESGSQHTQVNIIKKRVNLEKAKRCLELSINTKFKLDVAFNNLGLVNMAYGNFKSANLNMRVTFP